MSREARRFRLGLGLLAATTVLAAAAGAPARAAGTGPEDARTFIDQAETRLLELGNRQQRASGSSRPTSPTTPSRSRPRPTRDIAATIELAKQAQRFAG